MSIAYDDQAVTPNRDLRVLLDVDESVCVYPGWEQPLQAADIGPATQAGAGTSVKVQLAGGDPQAWELENFQANSEHSHEWIPPSGVYYRLADLVTPSTGCMGEAPLFRAPADIPGVYPGGVPVGVNSEPVQAAGDWFLIKKLIAGADTVNNQLLNDAIQYSSPDLPTEDAPMDRVAVGKSVDAKNSGYHLRFLAPLTGGHVPDTLWTFFFGGETLGANARGAYCLAFRGSGIALLYERLQSAISGPHTATRWQRVGRFRYAAPNAVAGRWHAVNIRPHSGGGIRFEVTSSGAADRVAGPDPSGGPHFSARPPDPHSAQFVANSTISGPLPAKYTTGEGPIRIDVRRDLLMWIQVSRSSFPILPDYGLLEDQPRMVPFPMAVSAETALAPYLWLQLSVDIPDACTLLPTVYQVGADGADGAALTAEAFSPTLYRFQGAPGVQLYRLEFKFTSTDQFFTPRLFTATLYKEPVFESALGLNIAATPSTQGSESGGASVVGTDRDPRHESASAFISDLTGQGIILRRRARVRSKIQVGYLEASEAKAGSLAADSKMLVSNLFEGEMAHGEGQLLGTADLSYPSPDWRDFDSTFVGMWARGEDTYNFYRLIFNANQEFDPNTGTLLAPRITDLATRVLYNQCGVPLEEIDIPDAEVRFLPSPDAVSDYMMNPRSRPWDFVLKLFQDYLGWVFFRDPNAGPVGRDGSPRGMWRARPDTDLFGATAPLWSFVFGQEVGAGPSHDWFSYPPGTSFIQRPTYKDWVEPPEANAVYVIAPNDSTAFSGGAGRFKNSAVLFNTDSFNAVPGTPTATDRMHPDFLGRMVPFVLMDPTLSLVPDEPGQPPGSGVQSACNRLCYYVFQRIAHARKRFRFRAPMPLVADATDPMLTRRRPLRMNDPILVNGFPAILKSADLDQPLNPSRMWGLFQGTFTGVGAGIPM